MWRELPSRSVFRAVVGFGLAAAAAAYAAEPQVPEDRLLYKDVVGKVLDDATGKPLAGVPVSLLYETAVTDDAGGFRFAKVPLSHTAQVSLRVRSKTGYIIGCIVFDVPVRFYPVAVSHTEKIVKDGVVVQIIEKADVRIVDPGGDEALVLRAKKLSGQAVDAFCTECHDRNPCLETTTYKEVVQSGKDLRGIIVNEDEVEAYKKRLMQQGLRRETYQKLRYQDSHPDGMNMDVIPKLELPQYRKLYQKPPALRLRDEKIVTCDTCHTRHLPTEQRQYVVMPFEKDSALCCQCHL